MFFASTASGSSQIWRQRFPDGQPEQLTFEPTTAEGLALSPDGGTLISSIGLSQNSGWLHEGPSERQVSTEGDAIFPAWGDGFPSSSFAPDGNRLYYLMHNGGVRGFGGGVLWVADLVTGTNEPLLPGV